MQHTHDSISFGFTKQRFPPGAHVCQIYTDEEERQESVLKFLLAGLQNEERTSCFSEKVNITALKQLLEAEGIPFEKALQSGAISLNGTRDVYFRDGCFDPEKMLSMLKDYHRGSVELGFTNARVIGEMTAEIEDVPGGDRLLEYESRVSLLLKEHPVTAVCQYSAHDFSGAVIMDVLKVHPFMVVRGSVVHNPFYIPPEQFLT
jgi:hypothetical protein